MNTPKKKLFTPKGLSNDENNRYLKLNQEQPIKDGIRINQYDYKGNKQGYWEEYFPNNQLNYKGSFKNGERDGIWEKYFDNGQIGFKGSYNNGDRDGIWEEYWSNGKLWYKGSYKNGEKDGLWEWYYTNGQLRSKGSYKNGEKEGYWEYYNSVGSLYTKYLYKDGKIVKYLPITESEQPKKGKLFIPRKITGEDSRYIQWNKEQPIKDGKRINQYDLTTADMTGRWGEGDMNGGDTINLFEIYWDVFSDDYYLEDGKLSEKENVFNDLKDRILSNLFWDIGEDGPLGHTHFDLTIPLRSKKVRDKFEELYNERQPLKESEQPKKKLFIPRNLDSKYKEWNEEQPIIDGARINQYNSNGKKDGLWIEYWDGFLSSKIMWKNGEQNGIYQTFHLNGQIQYDGMTKDGNFHGVWKMYYQNSGLREICNYENDRLVGVRKWFHPSGQLNLIANYIDGKVDGLSITYNFDGTIHRKDVYSMAKKIAYIVYDEDGSVRESMDWKDGYDNIIIKEQMENKDKILKSFEPQKELNPKVWDEDGKLKKKIKDTLVAIGQEFHKTLEVEAPIDDIIFTGSLANYNWSQYSDVDLHVLMDFNEFDDKELIKKYFDAKKAVWNDNHDIKIKGYDVELYAQDKDEPHESTGIYSVMNDEWVKKPKPQDVKIDRETIKKKVKQFEREYNRILELYNEEKYEETRKALDKIKDKIKKYRKAGLDKGGEMATENLVFKTMRRSGLMEKIYDLGLETTDKQYTIETLGESKK
jgi:antitoxin component YwqK of YwqJK toxin-antitoxin module